MGVSQQAAAPRAKEIGKGGFAQQTEAAPHKGWHTWYWGDGLNLILSGGAIGRGSIVGVHMNEARLMADVIGILPETNPEEQAGAPSRIALLDASGKTIYQWGVYEPADGEMPAGRVGASNAAVILEARLLRFERTWPRVDCAATCCSIYWRASRWWARR